MSIHIEKHYHLHHFYKAIWKVCDHSIGGGSGGGGGGQGGQNFSLSAPFNPGSPSYFCWLSSLSLSLSVSFSLSLSPLCTFSIAKYYEMLCNFYILHPLLSLCFPASRTLSASLSPGGLPLPPPSSRLNISGGLSM